jgi:hypothetical protein
MNKKYAFFFVLLLLIVFSTGCGSGAKEAAFTLGIERRPERQNLKARQEKPLQELPAYNPEIRSRPDLRSHDLTGLNLTGEEETLLHSGFNTETLWPANLPEGFDPQSILEINKNPGLQLRSLHEQGINGEGVGVAVIDYTLLVEHGEYRDKLLMYRELNHEKAASAEFHGSSMASIIAGNSTGVAPAAKLYFVAARNIDIRNNDMIHNQNYTAQAIRGLIRLNETLPEREKFRVISISQWWSPHTKGYQAMCLAVEEASAAGIFVVSCNLWQVDSRFHIHGLEKDAYADPDDFDSYRPASWEHWLAAVNRNGHGDFYEAESKNMAEQLVLLIPSGGVVSAGAESNEDYSYTPEVNWSCTIPYLAGLYALSCQVKPHITPQEFWQAAYQTGIEQNVQRGERTFTARIVRPLELIRYLQQ